MAKDITRELLLADSYSKNWSNQLVWETLEKISELTSSCRIDWDENAGETWGVILNNIHTISIVCTILPIIFYRADIINNLDSIFNSDIVLVPADSFDEKSLTLKKGMIAKIFGIDNIDIDEGMNPFSINDLYYCTI